MELFEKEIWKNIEGSEGAYQISKSGKIKSFKSRTPKVLKPRKCTSGYFQINLSISGELRMFSVHRLVAQTFIPNPENKREVNHINGVKTDNRVENLEWATRSENILHAYRNGLNENQRKSQRRRGKNVIDLSNGVIYSSCSKVAKDMGISHQNLSSKLTGKRRNNTSFRYLEDVLIRNT